MDGSTKYAIDTGDQCLFPLSLSHGHEYTLNYTTLTIQAIKHPKMLTRVSFKGSVKYDVLFFVNLFDRK